MEKKKLVLNAIFALLIGFLILIISYILTNQNLSSLLWLCYIGVLLIAIGIKKNNTKLMLTQITILLVPNFMWIFDLFYILIFNSSFLNLATPIFNNPNIYYKIISLQHLFITPLALYALYLMKTPKFKGLWKISFVQLTLFFFLSRIFSSQEDNVNCAYRACFNSVPLDFLPDLFGYSISWFIFMFSLTGFSYWLIFKTNLFIKDSKLK